MPGNCEVHKKNCGSAVLNLIRITLLVRGIYQWACRLFCKFVDPWFRAWLRSITHICHPPSPPGVKRQVSSSCYHTYGTVCIMPSYKKVLCRYKQAFILLQLRKLCACVRYENRLEFYRELEVLIRLVMLYYFFCAIPRCLNFICRRFRTLHSFFIGGVSYRL